MFRSAVGLRTIDVQKAGLHRGGDGMEKSVLPGVDHLLSLQEPVQVERGSGAVR